ncbi:hypothetical protein SAMD00019534_117450, partial [Acytostelium subglobosum LB1]|uniref:hypothetical protein n=1 Tax=Acytostelium subglobosum LB1 TaxID=1410327 RepID=UPI000644C460
FFLNRYYNQMDKTAIYYDINYSKSVGSLKMDLYEPSLDSVDSKHRFPLLVFVHGGFWMDRDKSEYTSLGRFWASQGLMVAIVNYRLSKKAHKTPVHYPSHNNDLSAAIRWLITNHQDYRYDINNINLMGHSCGAHMVSMITLQQQHYLHANTNDPLPPFKITRVIGIQGIFDNVQLEKDFPSYLENIQFVYNTDDRTQWESPQQIIACTDQDNSLVTSTAWMLVHAPTDEWVNSIQSHNFAKRLLEHWKCQDVRVFEDLTGAHFEVVVQLGEPDHSSLNGLRQTIKEYI